MPSPPYAKALVSVDGGPPSEGPLTVAAGSVLQFSGELSAYWSQARWYLRAPYDFPAPSGWALDASTGLYTSTATLPAPIDTGSTWGKWAVRLLVDDGNTPDLVSELGVNVLGPGGIRGVMPKEGAQFDPVLNWGGELEKDMKALAGGSGPFAAVTSVEIPFVLGEETTTSTIATRKGARTVDLSQWPATSGGMTRSITLVTTLDSSASGATAIVDLYDATHGVQVDSTQLDNTGAPDKTQPFEVTSAALTVGTASGNLRSDAAALYLLRIRRSGGAVSDAVTCTNARLRIAYAA